MPGSSPVEAAASLEAHGDGRFGWSVPDGWQQGRGAWGGLVVAALVHATEATEPDAARSVRSISAQLVAPAVVGEHEVTVRPIRIGSAMSTWGLRIEDARAQAVAEAVVITGAPRTQDADDHHRWGSITMPDAPAADRVPRVPGGPPFPVFTQHAEMRPIAGLPFAGGPAESMGWIGYDVPPTPSAATLLALVDAWWPASLPLLTTMPRVATVSFAANLLVDPVSIAAGELLLSHSFVAAADEGFTSEQRRLWTADGRLAVDNLQSIVIGS